MFSLFCGIGSLSNRHVAHAVWIIVATQQWSAATAGEKLFSNLSSTSDLVLEPDNLMGFLSQWCHCLFIFPSTHALLPEKNTNTANYLSLQGTGAFHLLSPAHLLMSSDSPAPLWALMGYPLVCEILPTGCTFYSLLHSWQVCVENVPLILLPPLWTGTKRCLFLIKPGFCWIFSSPFLLSNLIWTVRVADLTLQGGRDDSTENKKSPQLLGSLRLCAKKKHLRRSTTLLCALRPLSPVYFSHE